MQRSAAPSQLHAAKRPRFISPLLGNRSKTPSSTEAKSDAAENAFSPNEVLAVDRKENDVKSCAIPSKPVANGRKLGDILRLINAGNSSRTENIPSKQTASPKRNNEDFKEKEEDLQMERKGLFSISSVDDSLSDLSQLSDETQKNVSVPEKTVESVDQGTSSDDTTKREASLPHSHVEHTVSTSVKKKVPTFKPFKVPVSQITETIKPPCSEETSQNTNVMKRKYFNVMWCKASKKKHKKWEGDAVLITRGRSVSLVDMEGKEIGKATGYKTSELDTLAEGQTLFIGGKEIEVMGEMSEQEYSTGRCFQAAAQQTSFPAQSVPARSSMAIAKPFMKPQRSHDTSATQEAAVAKPVVGPRFDPHAPDALVMPRPTKAQQWEENRSSSTLVDVVVDPYLTQHLRPHQRDGILFLYQCIMGMRGVKGHGAILADEMGLGKTLQCISLIWTLLKQGPYGGKPVIRKTLIITPGSLVKNWCREFRKWLGNERIKVFAVGQEKKPEEFVQSNQYPVMVVSYEMFVRTIEVIRQIKFDLIVCDEGHRLKNSNIKTTLLVSSLQTTRRILLTGTPVQNDLLELYSLVDFCNPGILGSPAAFKHVYEGPILASHQPTVTQEEAALGRTRAAELNRLTSAFILRRTQEINNQYLPPKADLVLFCQPSELQLQLYKCLVSCRAVRQCLSTCDPAKHLMVIAALKKLCNHPALVYKGDGSGEAEDNNCLDGQEDLYQSMKNQFPQDYDVDSSLTEHSGKLMVLSELLAAFKLGEERVVLVSNYTQTLDVMEKLCSSRGYTFLRLDGQTPTAKRQQLVERFNSRYSQDFVFLLSSKAGGVGLNLIGASRLVLYDIDWNPANDIQAMARVWRDGQRRKVFIYRLITTGTLEEKIFQRQVSKQGLSGAVVDAKASGSIKFSPEELKDLFRLETQTLCSTHELLKCSCGQKSTNDDLSDNERIVRIDKSRSCQLQPLKERQLCMSELLEWHHAQGPGPDLQLVDPLISEHSSDSITFAFWCETNTGG